jgi:hypothetical protein
MNMICRIILKTSITSSNCNIEDLSMEMFEIIDKFAKKKKIGTQIVHSKNIFEIKLKISMEF